MSKVTISEAAEKLYKAVHNILLTADAGKPITQEQLDMASDAHDYATKLRALRSVVFADSHDDREVRVDAAAIPSFSQFFQPQQ